MDEANNDAIDPEDCRKVDGDVKSNSIVSQSGSHMVKDPHNHSGIFDVSPNTGDREKETDSVPVGSGVRRGFRFILKKAGGVSGGFEGSVKASGIVKESVSVSADSNDNGRILKR
jgi:cytoskeletal protein CcmA (bactofilin family)